MKYLLIALGLIGCASPLPQPHASTPITVATTKEPAIVCGTPERPLIFTELNPDGSFTLSCPLRKVDDQ